MNDQTVSDRQEGMASAKASINRNATGTRLLAGVALPDSPLITAAIEYAHRLSEPYLFNHAMRSWLFAEAIGRTKGIDYDREVVAIGTILHDIGLTAGVSGPNRFEVNGSRGSVAFDLERMNELELYEESGPESGFRTILATDASHPYAGAWWPPGHILGYEHTFVHTVRDFVEAVATGGAMRPDFEDGLANQRVLDAIERSAASRRWEKV